MQSLSKAITYSRLKAVHLKEQVMSTSGSAPQNERSGDEQGIIPCPVAGCQKFVLVKSQTISVTDMLTSTSQTLRCKELSIQNVSKSL